MESGSFVTSLILLAAAGLRISASVDRELKMDDNMQTTIENLEFENRQLGIRLEEMNTRTDELEMHLNLALLNCIPNVIDNGARDCPAPEEWKNIKDAILALTVKVSELEIALQSERDCGPHKEISNGNVSGESTVGGTPVISCDPGYSQKGSAQCKVAVWETDVKCQKYCARLNVANGVVKPSASVRHGTTVTVVCNSGYAMVGTNTATCLNGVFAEVPSCRSVLKDCAKLHVANGRVTPNTTVPHGTTVTVMCDIGYAVVGNNTVVCNNGTFSGVPPCVPSLIEMSVGRSSSFNVRFSDDAYEPEITGAEFLPNGELVLCDVINQRIKLLDTDFTLKDSLKLHWWPYGVSAVNSSSVITTLINVNDYRASGQLQYVHIGPSLRQGSTIQLNKRCFGVEVIGKEIFTSCQNNPEKGEVMVLELTGTLKRRILNPHDNFYLFKGPYHLSVSAVTGNIYVSDFHTDTITCLSPAGDIIYQYSDPELDGPRGISIDMADNVIVCGFESNTVQILTASGKKYRTLLTSGSGIMQPFSIAFRQNDKKLVVGSFDNNNLLVIQLE